jgi:Bacterial capsule synthesis protein PGA_cap
MVKLIIGGDICATKRDENAFLEGDAQQLFNDLLPEIKAADFSIANLETPLITEQSPIKKSGAVFGNSPKMLNAIKESNITFLNLANNHILDHGEKGLKSTVKSVKDYQFDFSGAGETIEDASKPFTTVVKGKNITVLSYAENEFSIAENGQPGANPVDVIDFVSRIKSLKETSDFIILLYHGGKENYNLPSPKQQKLCHFFIDQGVNMVVCQHSHTAGVYEAYNQGNIYYGQGNFIFDAYPLKRDWLYKGYLIEVVLHDDNTTDIKLIPYLHKSFLKDEIGIRKMTTEEAKPFMNKLNNASKEMIQNPNYIQEEWLKLSKSLENTYFSILNGNGKVMRKLNEKFSWLKLIYKNDRKLVLKNIVTCETHREIVETILKDK